LHLLLAIRKRFRPSQGRCSNLGAIAAADSGQAIAEYALVSATFAVLMIVAMVAVQHNAGSKLNTTQNNLSTEYSQVHA
jgi:Flp pilus assembly pilin Flp